MRIVSFILFSIEVCLISLSPSYAGWSPYFDMEKDISESISYKAHLPNPYSQLENWADEYIIIKLTYALQALHIPGLWKSQAPEIVLPPRKILIFSPDEMKGYTDYRVIGLTAIVNDKITFERTKWQTNQNKPPIHHITFLKNSPTQFIPDITMYNIKLKKPSKSSQGAEQTQHILPPQLFPE